MITENEVGDVGKSRGNPGKEQEPRSWVVQYVLRDAVVYISKVVKSRLVYVGP